MCGNQLIQLMVHGTFEIKLFKELQKKKKKKGVGTGMLKKKKKRQKKMGLKKITTIIEGADSVRLLGDLGRQMRG